MIHYIKGIVTETMPGMVIIENSGIGYEIFVPDGSNAFLALNGEPVQLYTAMMVREDDVSLYGFTDKESLKMFRILIGVSGVGAKAALAVLSVLSPRELRRAVAFEDINAITRANGIGKKTAQRIVLELKDKISTEDVGMDELGMRNAIPAGSARDEAVAALMSLGYSRTEAMSSLIGITDPDLSTEELIRLALRAKK